MIKRALITGISGQDGSHLTDLLLDKGYEVYGLVRRSSAPNLDRIAHIKDKIHLLSGDLNDLSSLLNAFRESRPDEIYNLAAQSFAPASWEQPYLTGEVTGLGAVNMLDALRSVCPEARFYQASTSEMFGRPKQWPQNEDTPFAPRSPYGAAKAYAHFVTVNYRERYKLRASCGILYNHEGERRGSEFISRKVTQAAARIRLGLDRELRLGNLEPQRDWGYAPDYCINADVPILTTDGWKFRDEIESGQEIINFDSVRGCITRDIVLRKVEPESDGRKIVFEGRGVFLRVTPNHRMIYQQKSKASRGGWSDWKESTAQELFNILNISASRTKYDYRLPHFQDYDASDLERVTDEQIYLLGVLLAEGWLRKNRGMGRGIEISVSQSRIANSDVYEKIQKAIDALQLSYRFQERNDGVVEWCFNSESSLRIIEWFDAPDVHIMPSYCYSLSARQAEILFTALMDCDGSSGAMIYTSKRRLLAVDFQTIAHLAGYRTSSIAKRGLGAGCYVVTVVSHRKKHSYIQFAREENDGEKNVWCVQTKNGTIITRDNDCIVVSGNCKAMWLMLQQDEPQDYVIATGVPHTVEQLVETAFSAVTLNWHDYVIQDERFMRPVESDLLVGNAFKAWRFLNWKPTVSFETMIKRMVEHDFNCFKNGARQ